MKYKYFFVTVALSLTAFNAFGESEMDSEINDLQVRIIKIAPKPKAKPVAKAKAVPVTPKVYTYAARPAQPQLVHANFYQAARVSRPVVVASTRTPVDNNGNTNTPAQVEPSVQPIIEQNEADTSSGDIHMKTTKSSSASSDKIIRRIELLSSFTSTSFDGPDSSSLIPSGVSSPYNSSFQNAQLLTDIDFGSSQFFIESGLIITQMGSGAGYQESAGFSQATTFSEKITLTYVGVPLNLKWRLSGEEVSSFFVKAGAIPTYMMSHAYVNQSSNLNMEYQFGAYNTFDILFDAGVGYDFKVWRDFHAILDISAFQGILPVLANDSVFNYGLMVGLGAAYVF